MGWKSLLHPPPQNKTQWHGTCITHHFKRFISIKDDDDQGRHKFIFQTLESIIEVSSKLILTSFSMSLHKGCSILLKSLMNLWSKKACPKKLHTPFTEIGGGNFWISSIYALSTTRPFCENLLQSIIPYLTITLHSSQVTTKIIRLLNPQLRNHR